MEASGLASGLKISGRSRVRLPITPKWHVAVFARRHPFAHPIGSPRGPRKNPSSPFFATRAVLGSPLWDVFSHCVPVRPPHRLAPSPACVRARACMRVVRAYSSAREHRLVAPLVLLQVVFVIEQRRQAVHLLAGSGTRATRGATERVREGLESPPPPHFLPESSPRPAPYRIFICAVIQFAQLREPPRHSPPPPLLAGRTSRFNAVQRRGRRHAPPPAARCL